MGYDHLCLTEYFCTQLALLILHNKPSISSGASKSISSAVEGSLRGRNFACDFIIRINFDHNGAAA